MTDPNRADLELPVREPYPGWDPDPLSVREEPEGAPEAVPRWAVRHFGCAWFVAALLLLAAVLAGMALPAPQTAPQAPGAAQARLAVSGGVTVSPEPSGAVLASGGIGTALLGGYATFYATCPDCAAAGPNLRAALGPGWRGQRVTVVSGTGNVTVRLTDWCGCGIRHGLPTLLDVSEEAFQELAPLSAGIVRVSIEIAGPRNPDDDRMRVEDGGPTPPATDSEGSTP